jgi:hypothetical protein
MSVYVYAPITGGLTSYYNTGCTYHSAYCAGGCHPAVFCSGPVDIGDGVSADTWFDFWADPAVLSLKMISRPGIVCGSYSGSPWDDGVEVQMYSGLNATGTYYGSVFFGHVKNPYIGVINTGSNGVLRGVTQWAQVPGYCPGGGTCNGCYTGPHVHMEKCGDAFVDTTLSCDGTVTSAGNWIYGYG